MTNEIKLQQEELSNREENLAITLDSIGDAVIVTNEKGLVTRMNPAAENLTGWSLHHAKGQLIKDVFKIINASTREPIESPIDKVLAKGQTVYLSNNTTLISKEGKEYQIADSAAPILNSKNEIFGMVLVFNDVTEQYQLRESTILNNIALQRQEKELRDILDNMLDAVIKIDHKGLICSFNKSAELIFGFNAKDIIGENVSNLMPQAYATEHDQYLQNYLTTGKAKIIGFGQEVVGQRKNKETFPMRLSVAELPKDENGHRFFVGACQDLSLQKQQEEQLRRSLKMDALGKITSGIAHDYNNMLGVILGYSELLKNALVDQPKLSIFVDHILHASERGTLLTQKLIAFSRDKPLHNTNIDINQLLLAQQDLLQKILTVRIKLTMELADSIWPILVDKGEFEEALLNLCINAMHALSDNNTEALLSIHTCNQSLPASEALSLNLDAGDYVQLDICDNGCGMDESTLNRIFDPYFSTKGTSGSGLGLSQIFSFVNRSGGKIKVDSERGQGSQFVLYFPRAINTPQKASQQTDQSHEGQLNLKGHESILIVDDEPSLRRLASELLHSQGYKTHCAENAKQALSILEHETIDLVLSDVIMPDMDGYQLAKIIHESDPNVKILFVSGFSGDEHTENGSHSWQQNLLHKPYQADVLYTKIRSLLDQP